ncbi:glycerophosphodiester phosphodiesterase [Spirillospora sp. CA-294931]|uniref:glycerophosphodiester phosphodiesterase n=1 Tax=Spirillospora sp. CA-294931 TaxID=3240042 RepID=UPI003D9331A8
MFRRLGIPCVAVLAAATVPGLPALASTNVGAPTVAAAPVAVAKRPKVTNVAHRGASADAPENTLAAFRLARTQRAHQFELDVQETKDRKLVLMHDTTLARTTNVEKVFPGRAPWKVSAFTLAEIRRLDAGSWFGSKYKGERVPTLGESLRAMRGSGLGLLLEVKAPELYPGIERRLAAELKRHPFWLAPDRDERRLVVQSFNWSSARRFHAVLPKVPIGLLGTPESAELPGLAKWADQINPRYTEVTPSLVRRVHGLKMEMFVWTVDDPAAMRRVIRLKVDGVITNKPAVLNRVLGR